ncbi:hypothetical protein Q7C15_12700, partial [Aeromonas salmonicida]|uniref:hypothetical protein n=1 Tax=Aeromonas salmonicida TaxID=645 RepID=UPI0035C058F3
VRFTPCPIGLSIYVGERCKPYSGRDKVIRQGRQGALPFLSLPCLCPLPLVAAYVCPDATAPSSIHVLHQVMLLTFLMDPLQSPYVVIAVDFLNA